MLKIRERQKIRREFMEAYESAITSGASHEEAADEALALIKDGYGASPNWAAILKFILTILALLA